MERCYDGGWATAIRNSVECCYSGRWITAAENSSEFYGVLLQRKATGHNGRIRGKDGANGSLDIVKRTALLARDLGLEERIDLPMFFMSTHTPTNVYPGR